MLRAAQRAAEDVQSELLLAHQAEYRRAQLVKLWGWSVALALVTSAHAASAAAVARFLAARVFGDGPLAKLADRLCLQVKLSSDL